jgi:GT2 family glycosyltransferase
MRLSIIIVSWNVCRDLLECLRSIFCSNLSEPFEVIVVDNASQDETVECLSVQFPKVKLIQNTDNVGFPKANNQGLKFASGEYVLFLNPDTVIEKDTLSICLSFIDQHPFIGMLGCKVLYPDKSVQYECARNFPSLDAMLWESMYLHMVFPTHPRFGKTLIGNWNHLSSRPIPCLIGAFMLCSSKVLHQIGGMDVSIFMYFEDVDLCYRVKQAGWKVYYLADTAITHKSGQSQKKSARRMIFENADAKLAFFYKHHSILHAFICWWILLYAGFFRLTASIILYPIAALFPKLRVKLRNSYQIEYHLDLLAWCSLVASGKRRQFMGSPE